MNILVGQKPFLEIPPRISRWQYCCSQKSVNSACRCRFQRPSPDIKSTLYRLLFELLQNNWRYFFKSNVLAKIHSQNDEVYNEHQFIAIMQVGFDGL